MGYKAELGGVPLDDDSECGLNSQQLANLAGWSILTAESLYVLVLSFPTGVKQLLELDDMGLQALTAKLRVVIHPEILAELDKPVEPHPLGALRPESEK